MPHLAYILKDKKPVPVSLSEWVEWFEKTPASERTVKTTFRDDPKNGVYFVSTVFIGLDTGRGFGPPLVFETAIFRAGMVDRFKSRSWEEAEHEHESALGALETERRICRS